MVYDKGVPVMATRVASGFYNVSSWRDGRFAYQVNLVANTCTCPHFEKWLESKAEDCKHLRQARVAEWVRVQAIASAQPTDALAALLPRYEDQGRVQVALAIRAELDARQQVAQEAARNLTQEFMDRITHPCECYQMICEKESQWLSSLSAENQE